MEQQNYINNNFFYLADKLSKSFNVTINPSWVFTFFAIYGNFVFNADQRLNNIWFYALVWLFIGASFIFYKDFRVSFKISIKSILLTLLFFVILFLAHIPSIFYNITNDELYHAGSTSFILRILNGIILSANITSIDLYTPLKWAQSNVNFVLNYNFIQYFMPENMAVIDVWRMYCSPFVKQQLRESFV